MTAEENITAALKHLADAREQVPTNERPLITDTADALCLLLERLMEPEFVPPAKVTWKTKDEALTGELLHEDDETVCLLGVDGLIYTRCKTAFGAPRTDYTLRPV